MNTTEIKEEDCYITSVNPSGTKRRLIYKKGFVVYSSEYDESEDIEILKVLPRAYNYNKTFKLEKFKNECCGCGEENSSVNWVENSKHDFFELKNSCENCFDSGNLVGDDFP